MSPVQVILDKVPSHEINAKWFLEATATRMFVAPIGAMVNIAWSQESKGYGWPVGLARLTNHYMDSKQRVMAHIETHGFKSDDSIRFDS